jgi:hypothetical protein
MPQHLVNELKIKLPDPSDIFTKRKLEIDEAKARVVAAILGTGLFPREVIYKEYFELDDLEIEEYQEKLKLEAEEMAEMMPQDPMMGGDPMGGGGPPGAEGGAETGAPGQAPNVGGRSGMIAQKQPGSAGMDAPANEAKQFIKSRILNESNPERLKILKKIQRKLDSKLSVSN